MPDQVDPMNFPVGGMTVSGPFWEQAPAQLPNGQDDDGAPYGRTTPLAVNVRVYEASTMRRRGGTRPGLSKYVPQAVGAITGWIVQELASITVAGDAGL